MRLLALVTDAFGGRGGIAQFNRDLLNALCSRDDLTEVVTFPRVITELPTALPSKLSFDMRSASGKQSYVRHVLRNAVGQRVDGVICGHINLVPLAALVATCKRVPLLLVTHGIEAWSAPKTRILRQCLRRVNAFVSVSEHTRRQFLSWAPVRPGSGHVIPNCVDRHRFYPGSKRADLSERYGIFGRRVLLTVARLSAAERYKGVDEVIEVIPEIASQFSNLSYLIVGDGDDRARLQGKVEQLGIAERVVFTGYVPEHEKPDHYRLGDAFVMPGRGEGFGIAYLEALASGLPVVASTKDASCEVVTDRAMGELADPDNPADIRRAILNVLNRSTQPLDRFLERFSPEHFRRDWHAVVDRVFTT